MKYRPDEFVKIDSRDFDGFWDTLGKIEYEATAAWIISRSQKIGRFEFMETEYSHFDMIAEGYLIEDKEGKIMLTDPALDQIHEKYAR